MQLDNKVAIITGASSGIGAAAALEFASEGGKLVLGARRGAELDKIAAQIAQRNGQAVTLAGDVSDPDYAQALVDLALSEYGGLDIAFNNAGTLGQMAPVPDIGDDDWDQVIQTNLTSAFYGARAQIPAMTRRGGGSIIFTSSFVGPELGMPGLAAYATSKAGVIGLAKVIAVEHGAAGIRANALLPGATDTPMATEFGDDPEVREFVRNMHALKRTATPQEIAKAALFLASDHSSFVTGAALLADGGNAISKT
ncbi:SDR family oxidoreductase [Actibacterium sp. XHP0104]|uniref:SDR family oxidoreductase n=1 Tax=Actibacterium sp. XHP0104 TaxID=2984335 RepID=UPI0021E746AA|nr:SDR family oxidoreductase [Actibacterium sp. XHP0104]MCV2881640.1 SDR family oxidoreductase [Actibacterium sp. XHP0104]